MTREQVGAVFEARVKDLASDGRGVVDHPSGRAVFVAGVCIGEKIRAQLQQLKGRTGSAICIEILERSDHRVAPVCKHHGVKKGTCGGCPWQFIDEEAQLEAKQRRVDAQFSRLGVGEKVQPIWPSEKTFGYRNRAQFKSDGKTLGYISQNSNAIAPIQDCPILTDKNRATLQVLVTSLPNDAWRPRSRDRWVTLDIDESTSADSVSVNQRLPFAQANSDQNLRMRNWLQEKLRVLDKNQSVLELFCGSGNFTEVIAGQGFEKVCAVEVVDDALCTLRHRLTDSTNIETIRADLFSEAGFNKALFKSRGASVLVLDPPREGLKVKGELFSKKSKINQVFYISCDLATLVRDIKEFVDNKFKIVEVQPLDQFPHTPHIEVLVHLEKK